MITFPTRAEQKENEKYLEALEWLVSGNLNLGTGRTFLLAQAFVNIAVKQLNRPIAIFDHFPLQRSTTDILLPEVRLAAKKLYPKGIFKFKKTYIEFKGFQD